MHVKKYIVAGLLVWLPLAITIWVLAWILGVLDGVFQALLSAAGAVLPESAQQGLATLAHVPGLGVVLLVTLMFLTGMFVANFVGQWWIKQWDRLLGQIPIVKSIYSSVKQVSDTLFSSSGQAFREAVLVQYPREGSWTIAFVTGRPGGEVATHLHDDHVSLYVPTTPNPTSGFFLMAPRADVKPLSMSVDEALKYVISMGVVSPPTNGSAPAAVTATSATRN
ncbi:membrane protein [Sphaerotilus microaerophilus]|uniref:Membrane protein n=1 Tax=Sphaerotilus microaerophilus TaxID=2914710 RepID=A0ABM7YU12_9BURK|nr:membrane protein [Sphaerotilus sp. FB-5]